MSPQGALHALMDAKAIIFVMESYAEMIPNFSLLETNLKNVLIENMHVYLSYQTSKKENGEELIKDASEWLDSQLEHENAIIEKWKYSSKVLLSCMNL